MKLVNTVKKYTTFEDLKSGEKRSNDYEEREIKHVKFERIIKKIFSFKTHKNTLPKLK